MPCRCEHALDVMCSRCSLNVALRYTETGTCFRVKEENSHQSAGTSWIRVPKLYYRPLTNYDNMCRPIKGAQPQGLTLTVIPAMPRLDAELLGLPPVMLTGELRRCVVRLTNSGSGALANLRLAVASPDVFCSPTQGENGTSPDGAALKDT